MYKVLEANDRRGIVYEVIIACDQGWEPQGGVCVSVCTSSHKKTYHQAVIKKDKKHCTGPA